ncbi:MAG: hypothetical protein MMC33_007412 [Icmadophila ericetorum]|nr:hypothetical protein [Icmadophila ericetorum]
MSFGYGVGDIITVAQLARSIWKRAADAPDQFKIFRTEVAGLYLALGEVAKYASDLDKKPAEDLSSLVEGRRDVLQELDTILTKHGALGSEAKGLGAKLQKMLLRLKWD